MSVEDMGHWFFAILIIAGVLLQIFFRGRERWRSGVLLRSISDWLKIAFSCLVGFITLAVIFIYVPWWIMRLYLIGGGVWLIIRLTPTFWRMAKDRSWLHDSSLDDDDDPNIS